MRVARLSCGMLGRVSECGGLVREVTRFIESVLSSEGLSVDVSDSYVVYRDGERISLRMVVRGGEDIVMKCTEGDGGGGRFCLGWCLFEVI